MNAEEVVDFLIRRLRQFPGSDEQELAERLDARRRLFVWWINDYLNETKSDKEGVA